MNTTTLLWDVDGVLVDTEGLQFEAWVWLAGQYGKSFTFEVYAPMVGHGAEENMMKFCAITGIADDHALLQSMRVSRYELFRKAGVPPIEDNVRLVRQFAAMYPELRHAAVSSAPRPYVDGNVAAAGLSDFFVRTFSFDDKPGLKPKPEPDLYIYACEALGVTPAECIAFEDSESGINAAKAAGIRVVTMPTSMSPQEIMGG